MSLEKELLQRSSVCELCGSQEQLQAYCLPPSTNNVLNKALLVCSVCKAQCDVQEISNTNHWRCLNDSMWSEYEAVKIMSWRLLHRLKNEGWAQDLLDMMYIEDDALLYAKQTEVLEDDEDTVIHRDVNGVTLQAGDSVVLIKDLKIKGSSMVAKQGTAVRRISLDKDNAQYIEGKVDGQHIVILTQYVKKI